MKEALNDTPMFRDFAALDGTQRLPDETTVLRFRHLLEEHKLADQTRKLVNDMLGSKWSQGTPANANHSTHSCRA